MKKPNRSKTKSKSLSGATEYNYRPVLDRDYDPSYKPSNRLQIYAITQKSNIQSIFKKTLEEFKTSKYKISPIIQGKNTYHVLPIRQSFGVICAWVPPNPTECARLLFVQKRNTYAYNTFLHLSFDYDSDEEIHRLLCEMTHEEILDIASLKYDRMWYRIWFNKTPNGKYYKNMDMFNKVFLKDGGARLTKIISTVTSTSGRIWEFPKGHLDPDDNSPLVCAVREFSEEAGIDKKHYKIIPDKYIDHEYISAGAIYQTRYYIAIAGEEIRPSIGIHNISEITDIRWLNIQQIKMIDNVTEHDLERIARRALNIIKLKK